jgi:predicted AAA+ superfamily ATPase
MSWSRKTVTKIDAYKSQFRSLAIMGVRQCGKTTICKEIFKDLNYLNFENLTTAQYATEDPKQFLIQNQNGAVFDEIQRVPHLFNYLQELLDNQTERGKFVLTGSSNFLLNQNINQSLAGRIGFIEMYLFSY